ncbi:MAG TPA: DUF4190 domain-containing protein [Alcanivorax sp.]|nr:DUF4190 domain-containing protein [Alcanivorax sp.]
MPQYLSTIIHLLPVVIPAIVGLVLGITFITRARKASLLVIIASVVLLLQGVFQVVTNHFLVPLSGNGLLSWEAYSIIVSAGYFVLGSTTLGLLLAAAFVERGPYQPAVPATETERTGVAMQPHRGTLVLTLGLVSMLLFSPLGVVAWILGVLELKAMDRGERDPAGRGTAIAGMIFGIIGTVMMVVFLIAAAVFVYAFLSSPSWRY